MGGENIFKYIFTTIFWGEKIYLNIFSPPYFVGRKYIQIYFLPPKYGGEKKYLNIFSFTLGPSYGIQDQIVHGNDSQGTGIGTLIQSLSGV